MSDGPLANSSRCCSPVLAGRLREDALRAESLLGRLHRVAQLVCVRPARRDGIRTIVLDVGGGVDGLWKGMKIKVSGGMPCIVLTKHYI